MQVKSQTANEILIGRFEQLTYKQNIVSATQCIVTMLRIARIPNQQEAAVDVTVRVDSGVWLAPRPSPRGSRRGSSGRAAGRPDLGPSLRRLRVAAQLIAFPPTRIQTHQINTTQYEIFKSENNYLYIFVLFSHVIFYGTTKYLRYGGWKWPDGNLASDSAHDNKIQHTSCFSSLFWSS